jgi:hypothetical protein
MLCTGTESFPSNMAVSEFTDEDSTVNYAYELCTHIFQVTKIGIGRALFVRHSPGDTLP